MFAKWLDVDTNATWGKLEEILNSSAITCNSTSAELKPPNGNMLAYMYTCMVNVILCSYYIHTYVAMLYKTAAHQSIKPEVLQFGFLKLLFYL